MLDIIYHVFRFVILDKNLPFIPIKSFITLLLHTTKKLVFKTFALLLNEVRLFCLTQKNLIDGFY